MGKLRDRTIDLYILGAGVKTPDQITLETLGALRKCRIIYSIYPLSKIDCEQLGITAEIRSLWEVFKTSSIRRDTYKQVTQLILDAVATEKPVAFFTPGNPVVSDSVVEGLLREGAARGMKLCLLPGVSSIDAIMADIQRDVSPGLQIYDASWFVASNIVPVPYVPCLLLQLTTFGTWFATIGRRMQAGALVELRDYLQRFYSAEHLVSFVQSETRSSAREITQLKVSELGDVAGVIPGSLFIPAESLPTVNQDFIASMQDYSRFQSNYVTHSL